MFKTFITPPIGVLQGSTIKPFTFVKFATDISDSCKLATWKERARIFIFFFLKGGKTRLRVIGSEPFAKEYHGR